MDNRFTLIEELKNQIIIKKSYIDIRNLKPHEKILDDRLLGLENYIKSLKPYTIIPSIIICSKSYTVIDGHHRYYALKNLGINEAPATHINYSSDLVITDKKNSMKKADIINSACNNNLLPPKTTEHHMLYDNLCLPLILISDLMLVNREKNG